MSVVDYLLNSLIKQLQKTQEARRKKKKTRRKSAKKSRKSVKRKPAIKKRKTVSRKKNRLKQSVRKSSDIGKRKTTGKKKKKLPVKKKKAKSLKKKKKVAKRPKAKSKIVKKPKKKAVKNSGSKNLPKEVCIGEVTHYFSRIKVVVLKITGASLSVGDQIHVSGRGTDFTQKAGSLQIESVDVKTARKGQLVGLKVKRIAKAGSKVYKKTG